MDRNCLRRIVRRLPVGTLRDARPLRYCYEHRSFGLRAGSAQGFPVLFETRRLGALRHAAHPRNRVHVFIIVLSRNRRTPCHRRVDCGRHRHCTHDPYLERALWMHEPHACGLLLFGVNYRRRPHDIYLPRFRHSMALRHDLDFADILAPVRRPKLQCASGRQSAKHHTGQVLRALENHHPYGDLRFRLRAARKIPLCRHVRPPIRHWAPSRPRS